MQPILSSGINRRVALSALATVPALSAALLKSSVRAQTSQGANSAFSFAVYGNSRSMMYLPYKSAHVRAQPPRDRGWTAHDAKPGVLARA